MEAITIFDLGVGMLLATVALVFAFRNLRRRRAEHMEWVSSRPQLVGVVERLREIRDPDGENYFVPLIAYTLPNGQRYAIDGESSGAESPVGTEVKIAYDPGLPSTARVVSPASLSRERSFGDVVAFVVLTVIGTLFTTCVRA